MARKLLYDLTRSAQRALRITMTIHLLAASLLFSSPAPTCRDAPTRLVAVRADGARGVKLLEVPPGSFWERLRLRSGDVLLRINGQAVTKPELVCARLHTTSPTDLEISRRGSAWHIRVRLGDDDSRHARALQLCGDSHLVATPSAVRILRASAAMNDIGLQAGDVVRRVAGEETRAPADLCYSLASGDATIEVQRRGELVTLERAQ